MMSQPFGAKLVENPFTKAAGTASLVWYGDLSKFRPSEYLNILMVCSAILLASATCPIELVTTKIFAEMSKFINGT